MVRKLCWRDTNSSAIRYFNWSPLLRSKSWNCRMCLRWLILTVDWFWHQVKTNPLEFLWQVFLVQLFDVGKCKLHTNRTFWWQPRKMKAKWWKICLHALSFGNKFIYILYTLCHFYQDIRFCFFRMQGRTKEKNLWQDPPGLQCFIGYTENPTLWTEQLLNCQSFQCDLAVVGFLRTYYVSHYNESPLNV